MTYNPKAPRKGGLRKHLIAKVTEQVEAHKSGKHSAECMGEIIIALRKYQKAMIKG